MPLMIDKEILFSLLNQMIDVEKVYAPALDNIVALGLPRGKSQKH